MIWWEILLLREFPCGQGCALGARPGLIAIDVKLPSLRLRGIEGRGGGADVHEGEPAGVAMREHVGAIADQFCAVPSNVLAMPHIFVRKLLRRRQRQRLLLLDRLAGVHGGAHLVDRVNRIDGGGPRRFEGFADGLEVAPELIPVASAEGARALGQAVGRGGADRSSAAHYHVLDSPRGRAEVAGGDDLELMRQQPLFDEPNGVAPDIKRHGAEVAGATVDGDVQAIFTFIFRILVSILR